MTDNDVWILDELDKTTNKVTKNLENLELHLAVEEIYEFVWHKFADKYIEESKTQSTTNFGVCIKTNFNFATSFHAFFDRGVVPKVRDETSVYYARILALGQMTKAKRLRTKAV